MLNGHAKWLLVIGILGATGCDKQKENDCDAARREVQSCETKVKRTRVIASGPSHKDEVDAWRGEVRVCSGLDTIHPVETPAVGAALKIFSEYYAKSEPKCAPGTDSCKLEGPDETYLAGVKSMDAACN